MSPDQVFAVDVHGNFHSDVSLWNKCDDIIIDEEQPLADRLRALQKIDEIAGEADDIDVAALEAYAQMVRDDRGIN